MPELPEVETIARDLQPQLAGRSVVELEVFRPDVLAPGLAPRVLAQTLVGCTIRQVSRRGKNLLFLTEAGPRLLVNLGMTGKLVLSWTEGARQLRHPAVRFGLDAKGALLYDDIRRFGRMELHDENSWAERDAGLGPEPLAESFGPDELWRIVSASRSPVRNLLLDQRRIAGIGNIYANEALARAGIHPARAAESLSPKENADLHSCICSVLREAIRARGTTMSDYRDASGREGGFEPKLYVYARKGAPCHKCGTEIRREMLCGRPTFFCISCQPPQEKPGRGTANYRV